MDIFYTDGGFLVEGIHTIPADAVQISADTYKALLAGQASGLRIMSPDADHSEPWLSAPPEPVLETTVAAARVALREQRKAFEYGGFELDGQHWDSTEKDELRLNSVMRVFEAGIPSYDGWKIAEGVYITLTPELVQRAAMGLMQHYGRAFAVEAAKLAEINALAESGQKAIAAAESDEDKRIAQTQAEAGVRAWIANELPQGW